MDVKVYAAILSQLKPKFIHHPAAKEYISKALLELNCDPDKTYFDVPRLRSSTFNNYLTSGIAYAFHPHRDTWYSAPMCQLNWWIPIYEIEKDNIMAFHPNYWNKAVRNNSDNYNYQVWDKSGRKMTAEQIGEDKRKQPKPEEDIKVDEDLRIITNVGDYMIFSAAQLHSSVNNSTNKTRFSIDFLQVNSLNHLANDVILSYL